MRSNIRPGHPGFCMQLLHAGTKPGVSKGGCCEAMPMGTQGSQAPAGQGSSPLEKRTIRAHHSGKQEGADRTSAHAITSATFCWMGLWKQKQTQSACEAQPKGRIVPGQAAGNWSPSREVLRYTLLDSSSESYKKKADA